ncbi:hypothetical protein N7516_011295 [Penicillium verrucosum]|uniref:uncharacterized protein n=1 Tax=Penicillium verrucosum TaxID=60171 RepID=UPI0025450C59|nr:uncharacterized protein N7516_011295 [Penicillium verrucosum]KAJ5920437.1 hypothetical protein N7516_011295 [Penicillium verrucosum]
MSRPRPTMRLKSSRFTASRRMSRNLKGRMPNAVHPSSTEVRIQREGEGDHETGSKALGISKAACRMRFVRLQQKYGFKTKGKGTPRRQQAPASTEKEATPTKESN